MAALAPVASAAVGVRVKVNDGANVQFVSRDEMPVDVPADTASTLRSPSGEESTLAGGTSLAALAGLVGVAATSIDSVSWVGNGGRAVTISGDEVRGGFLNDPLGAPRFATIDARYGGSTGDFSGSVSGFRPVRDAADINSLDAVTTATGASLDVLIRTRGPLLTVSATASDRHPDPGELVTFAASGAPPDVRYVWSFGDGTNAQSAAPTMTHVYNAAGMYTVTVTVSRDADGAAGVSAPFDLPVGAKAAARPPREQEKSKRRSRGDGRGGQGTGGGSGRGGGTGDRNQRTSGPANSDGTGDRSAPDRPSEESGSTSPASATPSPSARAPSRTPEAERRAADPQRERRDDQREQAPKAAEGEPVNGIVLASTGAVADVIASAKAAAERERSPSRAGAGGGASALGWLAGGAVLIALFGAGAAREAGLRWRTRSS